MFIRKTWSPPDGIRERDMEKEKKFVWLRFCKHLFESHLFYSEAIAEWTSNSKVNDNLGYCLFFSMSKQNNCHATKQTIAFIIENTYCEHCSAEKNKQTFVLN